MRWSPLVPNRGLLKPHRSSAGDRGRIPRVTATGKRTAAASISDPAAFEPPTTARMTMALRERPLSPHLQVYRWQLTSVMWILHRARRELLTFAALGRAW